ncbi:MAG: hypothetical protein V5A68_06265 [Candidatus Thermoplasmatota archaeon]
MFLFPITATDLQKENIESENKVFPDDNSYVMTLHKIDGIERFPIEIHSKKVESIKNNSKNIDIEELIPSYLKPKIEDLNKATKNKEKNFLSKIFNQNSLLLNQTEIYTNALCKVKGVGFVLMFPPFLPITPFLYVGLLLSINSSGFMGEWNLGQLGKTVEHALMAPFVGVSIWGGGIYVFQGFSGFVIAMDKPDE